MQYKSNGGKMLLHPKRKVFLKIVWIWIKKSKAMLCYYDVILTKTKIQPFCV